MGTKIPAADTSLRMQVYDSLRDALTAGRFTPGQKLSFRFIAGTLGVSLTPGWFVRLASSINDTTPLTTPAAMLVPLNFMRAIVPLVLISPPG